MSPFCKPKPKVVRLFLGISLSDLGNQHGARMTVAAVSAPTEQKKKGYMENRRGKLG